MTNNIHRFNISYKTEKGVEMLYGTDDRLEAKEFLRMIYKANLELVNHNLVKKGIFCSADCPKIKNPAEKKCVVHGEEVTCYCEEKTNKEKVFKITI